jgi:hypothetical protein
MATRREKEKQQTKRSKAREWADQEEKKSGGGATCVSLPEGVEWLKIPAKNDKALVWDFVPYRAGARNPHADEGNTHWCLKFTSHRVPGTDGQGRPYVCARETFNRKCAVCDWLRQHSRTADEDLLKELKAKPRILFVVNDKPGDKKNPLKVFETHIYNRGTGYGELIKDAIGAIPETEDEPDCFPFSLEGGRSVQMKVSEDTFNRQPYGKVTRIDLVERDYDYPESLVDAAPCLDDCLVEPDYDELWSLLTGEPVEKDEAPRAAPAPRNGADKKPAAKPVDDDDDDDDEPDETPVRRAGAEAPAKKPSSKPAADDDDDEDWEDDEDGSDLEDDDDEDDEPAAKAPPKKPGKR